MSKSLVPGQARHIVRPDLGPNVYQQTEIAGKDLELAEVDARSYANGSVPKPNCSNRKSMCKQNNLRSDQSDQ